MNVPVDLFVMQPDGDCAKLSTQSGAPWFVGKLTRNECEDLLMEHGKQQHFVVRESTNLVRQIIYFTYLNFLFMKFSQSPTLTPVKTGTHFTYV